MAGHSKWANIRYRKERADLKKGKVFSRIAKEIVSSVRSGGADPKSNSRLRIALQKARDANLPAENCNRLLKKAAGQEEGDYHEVTYEIYGYGGVGILVEALTDNKNRTASLIRIAINKRGGTIAAPGSVSYNFDRVGLIEATSSLEEEQLLDVLTEAGAVDFTVEESLYIITTSPESLYEVKEKLEAASFTIQSAAIEFLPKHWIHCSKEDELLNQPLISWLEEIEDVSDVYHNMETEEA